MAGTLCVDSIDKLLAEIAERQSLLLWRKSHGQVEAEYDPDEMWELTDDVIDEDSRGHLLKATIFVEFDPVVWIDNRFEDSLADQVAKHCDAIAEKFHRVADLLRRPERLAATQDAVAE